MGNPSPLLKWAYRAGFSCFILFCIESEFHILVDVDMDSSSIG